MVDFISYAHFEVHTEQSLERMDRAWSAIHKNKAVFLELDVREHFNIPKFHSLIHYISSIHTHGTLDGYNCNQLSGVVRGWTDISSGTGH